MTVFASASADYIVICSWSESWLFWWKSSWLDLEKKYELGRLTPDYVSPRGETWHVLKMVANSNTQ